MSFLLLILDVEKFAHVFGLIGELVVVGIDGCIDPLVETHWGKTKGTDIVLI